MKPKMRPALLALACAIVLPVPAAHAAPTIGGGDCWRANSPLWCRGTWTQGQYLRIYTIDHFSDVRPNWRTAYGTSNSNWTSAPGPQIFSTSRATNDSWIYYEDSATGRDSLGSASLGITWNCDYGTYCSPFNEPMYVKFSSIKLNVNTIPNDSGTKTTSTFAHESGHALGLAHHSTSTDLMYASYNGATRPSADNSGALPPCTGSTSTSSASNMRAGVRCIYNWTS